MDDHRLAQKVKSLRKNKGYSQEALAEISGLSLRTVQRIENEHKNPSGYSLRRLSTALGVSPDYLLDWEPKESPHFLLLLAISPILFIIHPFLAIIVPLIMWSIKKNQIQGVKRLGVTVLKTQTSWLVVFYLFRTINYYRVQSIIKSNDGPWDDFMFDLNSQYFLKAFFFVANILIIAFITFKTYRYNKSLKSSINH